MKTKQPTKTFSEGEGALAFALLGGAIVDLQEEADKAEQAMYYAVSERSERREYHQDGRRLAFNEAIAVVSRWFHLLIIFGVL